MSYSQKDVLKKHEYFFYECSDELCKKYTEIIKKQEWNDCVYFFDRSMDCE